MIVVVSITHVAVKPCDVVQEAPGESPRAQQQPWRAWWDATLSSRRPTKIMALLGFGVLFIF